MEMSGIWWWLGVAFYVMGIVFWSAMAALLDARVTRSDYSKSSNVQFAMIYGLVWPIAIVITVWVFWIKWWANIGIGWSDKMAELRAELEKAK